MAARHVPVLDIGPFVAGDTAQRAQVARALGEAFEHTGFLVITGHGVSEALARETYQSARQFFALPTEDKSRCTPPEQAKGRGYLPLGIESVAATLDGETPPDLCEALVFASLRRERRGEGLPNLWPEQPPALRSCVQAWHDAMLALSGQLMRMSALALDLPEAYFEPFYAEQSLTLRFVNYPDQPVPPKAGQLRYGAHHDYGGLTILRQDDAPGGLQVCDLQGQWHDMPAPPDSFVINVGDLMSRWTNGRWRSTLHRVVNPGRELTGSTQRLSMVAFTGPNAATEVTCLPTCCSADNPARYPPVRADAYVRAKLAASMDLKSATTAE